MPIREVRRLVFKLAWAYTKEAGMLFPDALRHAWAVMRTTYTAVVTGTWSPERQAAIAAVAGSRLKVELRQDRRRVAVWLVARKVAAHAGWLSLQNASCIRQVWQNGGRVVATVEITGDNRVVLNLAHYRTDARKLVS